MLLEGIYFRGQIYENRKSKNLEEFDPLELAYVQILVTHCV